MKLKLFFLILSIMIFHFSLLTAHETIIDTVYSIAYLDGDITHSPGLGFFGIGANSSYGLAGDYYSPYLWDYFFNRSFFAFELPVIPEGYFLTSTYIYIYQFLSYGNDVSGIYPIFNMQTSTIEPPCYIEHLDYGYTLDETDFFLIPLHFIGTISNTPDYGWRSIEVTEYVLDDIENTRPFTQYRLRLALDTDNDSFMDALGFKTSNTSMNLKPYIIYIIEENSNISNEQLPENQIYLFNYPNPFNPITNIQFDIKENESGVLSIFNLKGQLIESHRFESDKHNYLWDASNQASGIYLYKLQTESITETRKMLLLK